MFCTLGTKHLLISVVNASINLLILEKVKDCLTYHEIFISKIYYLDLVYNNLDLAV